ncbi:ABC transporter ATP-binding protein [Halomontanus rarus]|uniref:ABC transporter ATP-binding protein n=1 Tax=Halomontanus rarus TaxID=3034020 RepID=UPI00293B8A05|nr:ABC transporter ATP-binding protein [Halovivax sp. KZCA124]
MTTTQTTEISSRQENILEVRDTTVSFDMDNGISKVLNNTSIDIQRGEILGIVGESGSGKSMFASSLLDAVVEPGQLSGEITYYPEEGEPINVLDLDTDGIRSLRWEHISMVFQGAMSSFNPVMKIKEHFRETLKAHGEGIQAGMDRARELLDELHLDAERVLDSYPHELSGGMSQRALIALSLVLEPDVLVMDEPTAALDLLMQRSIISLLSKVKEEYDLTLVFITHDLPLVAEIADRMAVMYAFDFVEVGDRREIIGNPAHPYTRALLAATPNIESNIAEMRPIEGSSPDPFAIPNGCAYQDRCPLATETCSEIDPDDYTVTDSHLVNCHHWEDSADAIPLHIRDSGGDPQ